MIELENEKKKFLFASLKNCYIKTFKKHSQITHVHIKTIKSITFTLTD